MNIVTEMIKAVMFDEPRKFYYWWYLPIKEIGCSWFQYHQTEYFKD